MQEAQSTTQAEPEDASSGVKVDLQLVVVLFGAILLLCSLVAYQVFLTPEQPALMAMLAAILLGSPVAWNTLRGMLGSNSKGPAHTEELVMIALLASFAASRYVEAAAIALFMYVASLIVTRTADGARSTIESLIRVSPKRATRLNGESEEEVAANELKVGDRVLVRPGDQIPCDGRVMSGSSTLDEKYITGESLPVDKAEGDQVFAASINLTGMLHIEVEKPLSESTLGKVQALILDAANYKTPVTQMLDRFARHYTPVVLCIAGIVLVFTRDIATVISLLLIACPMEIIISGPVAMVAALTAAARLGILIKKVTDIEVADKLTAVVFDKTGTLTTGDLAVKRLHPVEDTDPAELLRMAASLEHNSRHPIARAVLTTARRAKVTLSDVEDFEEVSGRGVRGKINGREVIAGREAWIRECGVDIPADLLNDAGSMSVLLLADSGRCVGWVGLSDQTRQGAQVILTDLRELGIQQRMMVTGDRRGPAENVAASLDLTGMVAEALPGDKLDIVQQLKKRKHTVAVIGDGVNDGPALAAADLSIAMGAAGSDVAINAASIALMNSQLNRLPFLVRLSRATNQVIRQNIVFVMLYVVSMVALLTFGYITPMIAALSHGLISIIVVFNSARLIRQGEDLPHLEEAQREEDEAKRAYITPLPLAPSGRIAG